MYNRQQKTEQAEAGEAERPDYLSLFRERLERLNPLPEDKSTRIAEKFGLNKVGLYPAKFVACVLYAPPDGTEYEILLLNTSSYERYKQGDHDTILNEFGVQWDIGSTFNGFVLQTRSGTTYLMVNGLWSVKTNPENGAKKAIECFNRYGIKAGFNANPPDDNISNYHTIDPEEDSSIYRGDFTELVDELVKEGLYLQIARTYRLTNTEYLRFRLTGKLPEDKSHIVSPNTVQAEKHRLHIR